MFCSVLFGLSLFIGCLDSVVVLFCVVLVCVVLFGVYCALLSDI